MGGGSLARSRGTSDRSREGAGDIVVGSEGLSFWGGVDPETGVVIDAHHDLHGQSLAGKIVLMPTSRGSCSGSGVLLQLALNGHAPTALVFREDEEILSLGAAIASRMFGKSIGVVRLPAESYAALSAQKAARLQGNTLTTSNLTIELRQSSAEDLELTAGDRAMLDGDRGEAAKLAMEIVCAVATAQGATRLIDISRGHIDGCIYAHEANLIFAETMADMGATVAVPTSINAISVDREAWEDHDLPPDFARGACRLADAYVRMGARPTFTCAPYLSDDLPEEGRGHRVVGIQRCHLREQRAWGQDRQASGLLRSFCGHDRTGAGGRCLPARKQARAHGPGGGNAGRSRRCALAASGLGGRAPFAGSGSASQGV